MFGLQPNELALVVFLAVLITAAGWLPRVGDVLGDLIGGAPKGTREPRADRPARKRKGLRRRPTPPADPPPDSQDPAG